MAFRLAHKPFLPSFLTLLLAVVLVTTGGCDKALSSPPAYPTEHTHQRQDEQELTESGIQDALAITELGRGDALASRGEERVLGKEEEEAEAVGEPQRRQVNKGRSIMAAARVPKSWPDLVGLDAEEAKKKILEQNPNLLVQIVAEGSLMTMDYNLRRVRIQANKEKKVVKAPQQG